MPQTSIQCSNALTMPTLGPIARLPAMKVKDGFVPREIMTSSTVAVEVTSRAYWVRPALTGARNRDCWCDDSDRRCLSENAFSARHSVRKSLENYANHPTTSRKQRRVACY